MRRCGYAICIPGLSSHSKTFAAHCGKRYAKSFGSSIDGLQCDPPSQGMKDMTATSTRTAATTTVLQSHVHVVRWFGHPPGSPAVAQSSAHPACSAELRVLTATLSAAERKEGSGWSREQHLVPDFLHTFDTFDKFDKL